MNLQRGLESILTKLGVRQDKIKLIQKLFKYLIITGINLILLTALLAIWTDYIELTINPFVLSSEFLKIIGLTFLSLILVRIAIEFFRKHNIPVKNRIRISIILTFIISSFLYFNYSKKIYENRILNRDLRKELANKIEPTGFAYGAKAENLTFSKYNEIIKVSWFPKLQKNADSIYFSYI
jgi:hypothetical protein